MKTIEPRVEKWLLWALLDWAAVLAAFMAINASAHPIIIFFAIAVIGTRQHALSVLGHDGGHRLICRNRALNDLLTRVLCFGPLMVSLEGFRRFHFEHHRTVGTPNDPELKHKNRIPQWTLPLRPARLIVQLLMDFAGGALPHVYMLTQLAPPVRGRDRLWPMLAHALAAALFVWLGLWWVPVVWFGSMMTAFWAAFRLRIWTEHVGTTGAHAIMPTWWQRLIFLPHNTWCHVEHHKHAHVPCWALPAFVSGDRVSVGNLFRLLATARS